MKHILITSLLLSLVACGGGADIPPELPTIQAAAVPAPSARICRGPTASTAADGTVLIAPGQSLECRLTAGQSVTVAVRQFPGLASGIGGTWSAGSAIGRGTPRYVVTSTITRVTRPTPATPLALTCPASPITGTYCGWRLDAVASGFSVR